MEMRLLDGRVATETELKMAAAAAAAAAAGGIVKAASSRSDLEICVTNNQPEVAAVPVPGKKVPAPVPPAFAGLNGGVKKTIVVPVSIEAIRALEKRRLRPPTHARGLPEHLLWCPAESLEEQDLRDSLAECAASVKALYDKETAILEQYREYGYANEMFEVDDSDEEEGNSSVQGSV